VEVTKVASDFERRFGTVYQIVNVAVVSVPAVGLAEQEDIYVRGRLCHDPVQESWCTSENHFISDARRWLT
jgi:hypothetical protein